MSKRRYRTVVTKEGEQRVCFAPLEPGSRPELGYFYGSGTGMRATAHCIMDAFQYQKILDDKNLIEILEERGYDITTLKFSIRKKLSVINDERAESGLPPIEE